MSYYRAHGSPLVPFAEDAANFLGSKPVMEGRGAMVMELLGSAIVANDRCYVRSWSSHLSMSWRRSWRTSFRAPHRKSNRGCSPHTIPIHTFERAIVSSTFDVLQQPGSLRDSVHACVSPSLELHPRVPTHPTALRTREPACNS
jgi:hypothetical protein